MLLTRSQAEQFCKLLDRLSIYAHHKLHIADDEDFFNGEPPRGIGSKAQCDTLNELWANRDIIDQYVRENPDRLTRRELDVVASWKYAYETAFTVLFGPDDQLYFFSLDYAFLVHGISKPIESMFKRIPTVARAVLLPFRHHIVFATYMFDMQIDIGPNINRTLNESLAKALDEGRLVSTGGQLAKIQPILTERGIEMELESLHNELEMEERANGPIEGQHRGALAETLDAGKRELARLKHERETLMEERRERMAEILSERCVEGPMLHTLDELLKTDGLPTREEVLDDINALSPETMGFDPEEEPELARRLEELKREAAEHYDTMPTSEDVLKERLLSRDQMQAYIEGHDQLTIEQIKKLMDNDGFLPFSIDDLRFPADIPTHIPGIQYLFRHGDGYAAIMPEEVLAVARQLDWDKALACAQRHMYLVRFFDAIADLRGIIPFEESVAEYLALFPEDGRDPHEIADELLDAAEDDESNAEFLDTGDEVYLVHFLLQWERRTDMGLDWRSEEITDEGELGELFEGLLKAQSRHEPRRVSRDMIKERDLFDWKMRLPSALAMRDYLDTHVPDGDNDYYFSERVLEQLFEEAMWGLPDNNLQNFLDILDRNGLMVDKSQIQLLVKLWNNLYNSLPNWPNNGWAPNELLGRQLDKRMFFNPDGSPMRVGRNDPCPCGSGKKYKRCCGR